MKMCKVKPELHHCRSCLEMQETLGIIQSCSNCFSEIDEYELLNVGSSFWVGDYAMVCRNGIVKKVSLDRIYDVREIIDPREKQVP